MAEISQTIDIGKDSLFVLEERQRKIISRLSLHFGLTVILGIILFVLTTTTNWLSYAQTLNNLSLNTLSHLTITSIITGLLNFFANLVLCIFAVWSISFIPFLVGQSRSISLKIPFDTRSKPSRWIQLYIAAYTPLIILALVWVSTTVQQSINIRTSISGLNEIIQVVLGAVTVFIALFVMNFAIPINLVTLRLIILSGVLYASLYLTYGLGLNIVSYMTLFGFLLYLALRTTDIENIGRRIAVYDMDAKNADHLNELAHSSQDASISIEETRTSTFKSSVEYDRHNKELEAAEMEQRLRLRDNQQSVRTARNELAVKISRGLMAIDQEKLARFTQIYEIIINKQLDGKKQEIEEEIKKITSDVESVTTELEQGNLPAKADEAVEKIDSSLDVVSKRLILLLAKILETSKETEKQMHLLQDKTSLGDKAGQQNHES